MCDPITLTAITVGASIASTGLSVAGQASAAKQQESLARKQHQLEVQSANRRLRQENEAAASETFEARVAGAQSVGTARASGLGERSVAALAREANRVADRNVSNIQRQAEFAAQENAAARTASNLNLASKLASIEQPDFIGAGLSIVSSVAGGIGQAGAIRAEQAQGGSGFGALGGR